MFKNKTTKKASNIVIVLFSCGHLCNTMSKRERSIPRIICVQDQHPGAKQFSHLCIEFLKSCDKKFITDYTLKQHITSTMKQ